MLFKNLSLDRLIFQYFLPKVYTVEFIKMCCSTHVCVNGPIISAGIIFFSIKINKK